MGTQHLAECGSPFPLSHPEGKMAVWVSAVKFIHRTEEPEQLASRHCHGAPSMGAGLSSGFSHEGKATSTGPLDTTRSSI